MNFSAAQFIKSYGIASQLPPAAGEELVFCGRSNVGKSSLINKLCRRKSLARVSSTPGKTTTINYFSLGDDVFLVDLPGYGYAKRSQTEMARWAALMESFFASHPDIKLTVQLLDSRHEPSADDLIMMNFIRQNGLCAIAVLTKTDKLTKTQLSSQTKYFEELLPQYGISDVEPFTINGEESAERLRAKITEIMG
ncbi:MAG: ribosome biogenesis GTP-binding protein YihA/YsxC [Oscillospiraceae bacterium]